MKNVVTLVSAGVRYQYFAAPATPTKSASFATTAMGAIAYITTGTVLYNPLSGSDGSLASYYEWSSLDPCYGHSSPDSQYHYHAVSNSLFIYLLYSSAAM